MKPMNIFINYSSQNTSMDRTIELPQNYQILRSPVVQQREQEGTMNDIDLIHQQMQTDHSKMSHDDCDLLEVDEDFAFPIVSNKNVAKNQRQKIYKIMPNKDQILNETGNMSSQINTFVNSFNSKESFRVNNSNQRNKVQSNLINNLASPFKPQGLKTYDDQRKINNFMGQVKHHHVESNQNQPQIIVQEQQSLDTTQIDQFKQVEMLLDQKKEELYKNLKGQRSDKKQQKSKDDSQGKINSNNLIASLNQNNNNENYPRNRTREANQNQLLIQEDILLNINQNDQSILNMNQDEEEKLMSENSQFENLHDSLGSDDCRGGRVLSHRKTMTYVNHQVSQQSAEKSVSYQKKLNMTKSQKFLDRAQLGSLNKQSLNVTPKKSLHLQNQNFKKINLKKSAQHSQNGSISNNATIIMPNLVQKPNFMNFQQSNSKMQDFVNFSQTFKKNSSQTSSNQKSITFRYQGLNLSNPQESNMNSATQSVNKQQYPQTINTRNVKNNSLIYNQLLSQQNSPRPPSFHFSNQEITPGNKSRKNNNMHITQSQFKIFSDPNSLHNSMNHSMCQIQTRKHSQQRNDSQGKLTHQNQYIGSDCESQSTKQFKEDLEKQQNKIIQRFIKGEITIDEAKKLDQRLLLSKINQKTPNGKEDILDPKSKSHIIEGFNKRMEEFQKQKQMKMQFLDQQIQANNAKQVARENTHDGSRKPITSFDNNQTRNNTKGSINNISMGDTKQSNQLITKSSQVEFEAFIKRQQLHAEKQEVQLRQKIELRQKEEHTVKQQHPQIYRKTKSLREKNAKQNKNQDLKQLLSHNLRGDEMTEESILNTNETQGNMTKDNFIIMNTEENQKGMDSSIEKSHKSSIVKNVTQSLSKKLLQSSTQASIQTSMKQSNFKNSSQQKLKSPKDDKFSKQTTKQSAINRQGLKTLSPEFLKKIASPTQTNDQKVPIKVLIQVSQQKNKANSGQSQTKLNNQASQSQSQIKIIGVQKSQQSNNLKQNEIIQSPAKPQIIKQQFQDKQNKNSSEATTKRLKHQYELIKDEIFLFVSLNKQMNQNIANVDLSRNFLQEILEQVHFIEKGKLSWQEITDNIFKELGSQPTVQKLFDFIEALILEKSAHYDNEQIEKLKKKYQSLVLLRNDWERTQVNKPRHSMSYNPKRLSDQKVEEKKFTPQLSQKSLQLYQKSRENSLKKVQDKLGQNSDIQMSPPSTEKNSVKTAPSSKISIYEHFRALEQIKKLSLEQQRQQKQIIEASNCTFKPEIISKSMGVQSKYQNYSNKDAASSKNNNGDCSHIKFYQNSEEDISEYNDSVDDLQPSPHLRQFQQNHYQQQQQQLQQTILDQQLLVIQEKQQKAMSPISQGKYSLGSMIVNQDSPVKNSSIIQMKGQGTVNNSQSQNLNYQLSPNNQYKHQMDNTDEFDEKSFEEQNSLELRKNLQEPQRRQDQDLSPYPKYKYKDYENDSTSQISEKTEEIYNKRQSQSTACDQLNNHQNTGQAPFAQNQNIVPLLHVDVKHGPDNDVTRLSIYEGDNIPKVVLQFAVKYGLSIDIREKLINYVQGQIIVLKRERRAALIRLQEEQERDQLIRKQQELERLQYLYQQTNTKHQQMQHADLQQQHINHIKFTQKDKNSVINNHLE
eukprot:403364983